MDWISIHEKLPFDGERVLTLGINGGLQICHFLLNECDGETDPMFITGKNTIAKIAYWLPIPPQP